MVRTKTQIKKIVNSERLARGFKPNRARHKGLSQSPQGAGLSRRVKKYVKELKRININPEKIFLYGSYASGTPHTYSDIDLLIISKDFKRNKPLNRLEQLSQATIPLKAPIEAIGYTPEELKKHKNQSIFWEYIKDNLIIVYKSS